ncbi:MAG: DNA polymerase III subunit delta [Peptostreptococcaceae bacterium]|nr:DNA polymerase III subunit delta [Peptostreptococcaceae bacterium]
MNHKELKKLLSNENKFIFIGEESYFFHYALDHLKKQLDPAFAIFNHIEIDQKTAEYVDCIAKLESVPMMDQKKIVHIKNFNFAVEGNPWNKKELEDLGERIQKLSDDTVLILSNESISKPGNLKLIKDLGKRMRSIEFARLSNKELVDFLVDHFGSLVGERAIDRAVIAKFAQSSGYLQKDSKIDLYRIQGMAEKAAAYFREYGKLDHSDVEFLFEPPVDGDIFRLIDAISSGKKKEAFRHYHGLRTKGEANIKIMVTIGKIFSTAVKASYYFEEGYSREEIAKVLKKSPYAIGSAADQIKKLGRDRLIDLIDAIVEVDHLMKRGMLDESVYGELALMKIFEVIEGKS